MEISFNINFIDDSEIWLNIWKILKEQLHLHYTLIKLKDIINSKRSLQNLNIKMISNLTQFSLQLYITKISNQIDLKSEIKEKLRKYISKNNDPFIIILSDLDNNESSINKGIKLIDSIKKELNSNCIIKLLPINVSQIKFGELIYDFFKEFNQRISNDITTKINNLYKNLIILRMKRNENKNSTFNYIQTKESLLNCLYFHEFYDDAIKLNEDDLFLSFNYLDSKIKLEEPLEINELDQAKLKSKIKDKTVNNIDYLQYTIYHIIKYCISNMNLKRLNSNLTRILSDFFLIKHLFYSSYHFNFWYLIYLYKIADILKTIKTDFYNIEDQEIKTRLILEVYYQIKKVLKNLALLINYEIPSIKGFYLQMNKPEEKDNSLMNGLFHEMDRSLIFLCKEVEENIFNEKYKKILNNKIKFLEEYLNIVSIIESFHSHLNQNRSCIKLQLERIPILNMLNRHSSIKEILIICLKNLRKENWFFITDFIQTIFLIFMNSQEKNIENLYLMIKETLLFASVNSNFVYHNLKIPNERSIYEIISKYFSSPNINLRDKSIIDKYDLKSFLNIFVTREPNIENKDYQVYEIRNDVIIGQSCQFKIRIVNNLKVSIMVSEINLKFKNKYGGEIFLINSNIKKFLLNEGENNKYVTINTNHFNSDMKLYLKSIFVNFECGIEGLFVFDQKKFCINISSSLLKFDYLLINPIKQGNFFYDTIYDCIFILRNYSILQNADLKITLLNNDNPDESPIFHDVKYYIINDNFKTSDDIFSLFSDKINKQDLKLLSKNELNIKIKNNFLKLKKNSQLNTNNNLIIISKFTFSSEDSKKNNDICVDLILTKLADSANIYDSDILIMKESINVKIEQIYKVCHQIRSLDQKRKNSSLDDKFLVQTTFLSKFSANTYISKSCDLVENYLVNDLHSANFVTIIDNKIENFKMKYFFKYMNQIYTYLPLNNLLHSSINKYLNYNYEININFLIEKEFSALYKEIKINVSIMKNSLFSSYVEVKLKENPCWISIGKSKYREKIDHNDNFNLVFTIMPIVDGFISIPEVEFFEQTIYYNKQMKNSTQLDFTRIEYYLVKGNRKIVKISPINNFQMNLNLF